jgi:RNA polymerase-associated protein RTF1
MVNRRKNSPDTESGEEKEELYLSEQEREHLKSLPEVEREMYINERYNQFVAQKEREKLLSDAMKYAGSRPEDKGKKRDIKSDLEGRPIKKPKIEEPQYNHRNETGLTLEDVEKIRISRDQLIKWCPHLYFEKTVIGAFVRINIGTARNSKENKYVICEVVDVKTDEVQYEIEGSKVRTSKMLVLKMGKTRKDMKIDNVSNTAFTITEFNFYMERLAKDEMKPVTQHHIQTKIQDIQIAMNYKYTREEIDQLVQRELKESLKKGQVEATATLELEKLRVQLEDLKNAGNTDDKEKIRNLEQLIKDLEKAIDFEDKIVDSDIVLRLNEKNRTRQLEIEKNRVFPI